MRLASLAVSAVLVTLPSLATAQASVFSDLLGGRPHHAVHRSSKARPQAHPQRAAVPEAAAPVPMPLPRRRPEAATQAEAAALPPAPRPEQMAGSPPAPAAGPLPPTGESPIAPTGPAPAAEGESTTLTPPRIYQTACPAVIGGMVEAKALPPIDDGPCAEQSPLLVSKILVNGRMVGLSAPATFNCAMASALPGWVAEVDRYIETVDKTRITSVTVGGSYECRPRNTPDHDADLSEHGRADALDFVGFTLADGRTLTVGTDYASTDPGVSHLMHFAHDAACSSFTTVLGPDANSLHHDHFHLDLGCHGKTCTYRLCE
jgi:hypothetical protein